MLKRILRGMARGVFEAIASMCVFVLLFSVGSYCTIQHFVIEGDRETVVADAINAVKSGSNIIVLKDDQEVCQEFNDRLYCEPELFRLDIDYKIYFGDIDYIFPFGHRIFIYHDKYEDVKSIQIEIDSVVSGIMNGIDLNTSTDYDKALYFYDWLIDNVEYCQLQNNEDQDIYGAFVQRKALCAGYAKAFAYLLNQSGIEAYVVSGQGEGEEDVFGPHAWTVAYLDGQPYCFDVTWDDHEDMGYNHDWFAVTSDEFFKSHIPDYEYGVIEAVSNEHNYYVRNDLYLCDKDEEMLLDIICQQGVEWHIKCADQDVLRFVVNKMEDVDFLKRVIDGLGIESIGGETCSVTLDTMCLHVKFVQ